MARGGQSAAQGVSAQAQRGRAIPALAPGFCFGSVTAANDGGGGRGTPKHGGPERYSRGDLGDDERGRPAQGRGRTFGDRTTRHGPAQAWRAGDGEGACAAPG